MNLSNKEKFLAVIGLLAYAIWGSVAFFYDHTMVADFMSSIKYIATGVVTIVVRDMRSASDGATPPGKVGQGDGSA